MTTLFYRTLSGVAESLEISTIQDLNIPDNSTIPSRPTITGEYRNQYVVKAARKVSFTAFLENGQYNGELVDAAKIIDKLDYLYKNRIKFNLTTTTSREDHRFLTDLVIENIPYRRDASHNGRHVVTINCVQVRLVDLGWKEVDSVDIFGENILESGETGETRTDMTPATVVDEFQLDMNWRDKFNRYASQEWNDLKESLGLSGAKQEDVNLQIRDQIEDKITLSKDDLYLKLGSIIYLSDGSRTYNCKSSCASTYGSTDGQSYNVDIVSATVKVVQNEGSLVPNIPLGYVSSNLVVELQKQFEDSQGRLSDSELIKLKSNSEVEKELLDSTSTTRYVYDFADTYKNFTISKSMEHVENMDGLAEYLDIQLNTKGFSTDPSTIHNHVIVKNYEIYTYQIRQRYSYSITVCGKTFNLTPSGGLDVTVLDPITTQSEFNYKPVISNTKYQEMWDSQFKYNGKVNYSIQITAVTLGSMLQLYVFAPGMLNTNMINYN